MQRWIALVTMVAVIGLAAEAQAFGADSWRCGHYLVAAGDSREAVHERCGDPIDRFGTTELVSVEVSPRVTVLRAVAVERWTYDSGRNRFVRVLTFEDGTLVDIDEGSYGGR